MLCDPNPRYKVTAALLTLFLLAGISQAETRKLTGQVFAYDPFSHLIKMSSFVRNQELVVFKLRNRPGFVKLVFASLGQEQIEEKSLDGRTTVAVRGVRDPTCDEDSLQFFRQGESLIPSDTPDKTPGIHDVKIEQKYRVTEAFSDDSIPQIVHLDCYQVEMPAK
jgi:hypothetical protein